MATGEQQTPPATHTMCDKSSGQADEAGDEAARRQGELGAKSTNWQPQQETDSKTGGGVEAWHMSLKLQQSLEQAQDQ